MSAAPVVRPVDTSAADSRVRAFRAAEDALLRRHGLSASSRYIDLDEPRLRVRVLEVGEGPAVIFLPGVGAVGAVWASLMSGIGGRRLIAVDRPGCGLSDPYAFARTDLRRFSVALVSSIVGSLGLERVSVVASSIGGTMALWFALARPEMLDRLVLMGALPFVLDANAPLSLRFLAIPFVARRAFSSGAIDMESQFVRLGHRRGTLTPELRDLAAASRQLPGYREGFAGLVRAGTGLTGRRVSVTESELRRITQPTLLVWGARDAYGPVASGQRIARVLPDARLEVCGDGHMPWHDEPVRIAKLTSDFLDGKRS